MNQDSQQTSATSPATWERNVLEKIALEALAEQRIARRWRVALSLAWLVLLILLLFTALGWVGGKRDVSSLDKHTALVELKGVIASDFRD